MQTQDRMAALCSSFCQPFLNDIQRFFGVMDFDSLARLVVTAAAAGGSVGGGCGSRFVSKGSGRSRCVCEAHARAAGSVVAMAGVASGVQRGSAASSVFEQFSSAFFVLPEQVQQTMPPNLHKG
eukprot:CAMPEP_0175120752 /NCGR_PEP_ID=MMETSP0087-20121206/793_1 /TAXON_ID=136419 /ORGANISM="Unknown Unknown, Strain D1" /LENGTH=123 /DNA_ID=CAMNT_0016402229 /DNA_START=733 /DNA_END=1104 /DNA_ORIENTATION=-